MSCLKKIFKSRFILPVISFILFSFLSIAHNNKYDRFSHESEYWADKAGYYIYLPAVFIDGFYKTNYPKDIDEKTGKGFHFENNKLYTKYTYGLAFLALPFFIIVHILSLIFNLQPDGFGPLYFKMADITAAFYVSIGLLFLFLFLKKYFSKTTSFITVLLIAVGTNLLYFEITDTFMSHVYLFTLISVFLYYLKQFLDNEEKPLKYWIYLSILYAFIVLLRPTDFIIGLAIPLLDITTFKALKRRIINLFKLKYILILFFSFLLVFLPQMIYWKFISGSYIFYSYKGEGFIYWDAPKILQVLFSTNNGLFPYNPLYFIIILGIILMFIKRKKNAFLMTIVFVFTIYVCAAWWFPTFGCSFGLRPVVDFLPLLAIGLAYIVYITLNTKHLITKTVSIFFLLFFTYFNVAFYNAYGKCFEGDIWDWYRYRKYINENNIIPFPPIPSYQWSDNFEHDKSNKNIFQVNNDSGKNNLLRANNHEFTGIFKKEAINIHYPIHEIIVNSDVQFPKVISESHIVLTFQLNDSTLWWRSIRLFKRVLKVGRWTSVSQNYYPANIPKDAVLNIYIWCPEKKEVYIDNFNLRIQ